MGMKTSIPFKRSAGLIAFLLLLAGCGIQTHTGQVTWSGSVDDTATVYFQSGRSWIDNVTAKGVQNANATFQGDLPSNGLANVALAGVSGRGQVALIQQPTRDNNYTAAVRVVDLAPGPGSYRFTLKW